MAGTKEEQVETRTAFFYGWLIFEPKINKM